jgi:hypothetical protein
VTTCLGLATDAACRNEGLKRHAPPRLDAADQATVYGIPFWGKLSRFQPRRGGFDVKRPYQSADLRFTRRQSRIALHRTGFAEQWTL